MTGNPFTALGLPTDPRLSDEQVRAAWRFIAAATHPDRVHGGDPGRYASASAAYAVLRTQWGRSEAYADLMAQAVPAAPAAARMAARPAGWPAGRPVLLLSARARHGRPLRLVLRILAAVLLALVTAHSGAGSPAEAGVITGLAA